MSVFSLLATSIWILCTSSGPSVLRKVSISPSALICVRALEYFSNVAILASVKTELLELSEAFEMELVELDETYDASDDELETLLVRAKSTDIKIDLVSLVWAPYTQTEGGNNQPAWI